MAAPSSTPLISSDLSRCLEDLMPGLCGVIPPLANVIAQYAAPDPPSVICHPDLMSPQYVAVSSNMIFISDVKADSVLCFGLDGSFVQSIGSYGANDGQLDQPRGLCVVEELLYVADLANSRVSVFLTSGAFHHSWSLPFRPWGILFAEGLFFLTDFDANCIHAYHPDGTFERSFGSPSEDFGGLVGPMTLAYWDHHIYAVFLSGLSVYHTEGSFVRRFVFDGQFQSLSDVAVCSGKLIGTQECNHSLRVYSLDGAFIREVGSRGSADDQFDSPRGIAVTSRWIFVVDRRNKRIRVLPHSVLE